MLGRSGLNELMTAHDCFQTQDSSVVVDDVDATSVAQLRTQQRLPTEE